MDETYTYHIKMHNGVDEMTLNTAGPVQVVVYPAEAGTTLLHTHTDQAGLIGLLRYLHQQGYVLLAMTRTPQETHDDNTQSGQRSSQAAWPR